MVLERLGPGFSLAAGVGKAELIREFEDSLVEVGAGGVGERETPVFCSLNRRMGDEPERGVGLELTHLGEEFRISAAVGGAIALEAVELGLGLG
jgi:hypothetical protein